MPHNLGANDVHLWFARDEGITDDTLLTAYRGLLSDEESEQQRRFHFGKHRHQYLVTRALVRTVLSYYIDTIPPEAWTFTRNRFNKPYLGNTPLPLPVKFNLSHTEKLVVLAVTLDTEIGVDVEFLPRRNTGLDIAEKYFSPSEFQELRQLPVERQKKRFFELWTLKEAYIKACGMGLAIPLDQFSYAFPRAGRIQITFDADRDDCPKHWNLWQIQPDETHITGLAVHRPTDNGLLHLSMREIVPLQQIRDVNYPVIARSSPDDRFGE